MADELVKLVNGGITVEVSPRDAPWYLRNGYEYVEDDEDLEDETEDEAEPKLQKPTKPRASKRTKKGGGV